MTVLAWTSNQLMRYARPQGKEDLLVLTRSLSMTEISFSQGVLAALTPLRDVLGLADLLPLLALATILVFRSATDLSGFAMRTPEPRTGPTGSLLETTLIWVGTSLYLLYRLAATAATAGEMPFLGLLGIEAVFVPLLMLLSDGILLAWLIAELRGEGLGEWSRGGLDLGSTIELLPVAALACFLAIPARYLAAVVVLIWSNVPPGAGATVIGQYLKWQASRGLVDLQAVALTTTGVIAVVGWSQGRLGSVAWGFLQLLRAEGGRLAGLLIAAGLAAGALSAAVYPLVLALPSQPWVLLAADSYAHYATLPVGLFTLAALVELGERALPRVSPDAAASSPAATDSISPGAESER
jgi:hypothetical protein